MVMAVLVTTIETITITNTAPELTSGSARVSEEGLVGGLADSNGDDLTNSRTLMAV
jgi:hypothetical protein